MVPAVGERGGEGGGSDGGGWEHDSEEGAGWGWDDPEGPDSFVDEPANDWHDVKPAAGKPFKVDLHFWPSKKFIGARKNQVFKRGEKGMGYYLDEPLLYTV